MVVQDLAAFNNSDKSCECGDDRRQMFDQDYKDIRLAHKSFGLAHTTGGHVPCGDGIGMTVGEAFGVGAGATQFCVTSPSNIAR